MRLFGACILSFFILSVFFFKSNGEQESEKHLVTVHHPAFGKDDPNRFYLWELRSDSGDLVGYFLDVESVICVDHRCKIVPVGLFWDAIGNYLKFELSGGVILEKRDFFEIRFLAASQNALSFLALSDFEHLCQHGVGIHR